LDSNSLFVTVATDNPRSEHMVPLAELMGVTAAPTPANQPPPPPMPAFDMDALMVEVDRRVAAALPITPPASASREEMAADLPAFMRRMAAEASTPPQAIPELSVEDAIHAVNDIETRMIGMIEGLARRLDEIAAKLDMAPVEFSPNGHHAAVETLTNWLRSIESKANAALEMASQVPEPKVEPRTEPAEPQPPAREGAIDRVQRAAAARRNADLGESADARDLRQRLVETALNAMATREKDITLMEQFAAPLGVEWSGVAKEIVGGHDMATALVIATASIETRAIHEIGQADERDIEAIVARSIEEIRKVSV
jgi:hypothetical protein